MSDPKYRVKLLAYETGQENPILDKQISNIKTDLLLSEINELIRRAIRKNGFEIILDIFEETKGAK